MPGRSYSPDSRRGRRKRVLAGAGGRADVRLSVAGPMVEEVGEPRADGEVVDRAVLEMRGALFGARHGHALLAARGPSAHHGVRNFRVELNAVGAPAVAERLHREGVAFGEQFRSGRQLEALAMPLIDVIGPVGADEKPRASRADRVIAALDLAFRMNVDARAEVTRQHLRAEADAEEWLLFLQRHLDPVDLAADEGVAIIGALWPAEHDGARVVRERFGQRIVEPRPANVERITARLECMPETARG